MLECNVNEISKYYGANKIFENISFQLHHGDRIGLIGQNGCGKTTLMKIMMGVEEHHSGTISFRKDAKIGYLDQIPSIKDGLTVYEVLLEAFSKMIKTKHAMEELEEKFTYLSGTELDQAIKQYGTLSQWYEQHDGYQLETKIDMIVKGLGISEEMKQMEFSILSGGEKTRVIFGRLLLEAPDILLLDEPSNHLDIASIEWLENFLKEYKGTVCLISHDRYFLDRVVNKIYELTNQEMVCYEGNYSSYVVQKEERYLTDLKHFQTQQKQIDRMKEQIHRYRVWGAMRDSEVMYKRAKELERRLEKIEVLEKPVLENPKISIDSIFGRRSGKQVIVARGIDKSFGGKTLIKNGEFTILFEDSIGLQGANGCGKTTLLKMVMGDTQPDCGMLQLGSEVKIGYLPQHVIFEEEEKTIVEYFSYQHGISLGVARGALAKMLFVQDSVNKQIKSLSGGEKSRLKLASLIYEKVNLLILDEPTNHLDISSREELEEALLSFEGTIFFVSHDRYFLEKVASKIMCIEDTALKLYPFGYQGFLEERHKIVNSLANSKTNADVKKRR